MSERLSPEEQKAVGIILGAFMILGLAIIISRQLFPIFLIGSIVALPIFIICLLWDIFDRGEYIDYSFWDHKSAWAGTALGIFLVGMSITWFIGYGIGGTSIGQASVDVYQEITGAQQTMQDSINQVVEESCKTLPAESCNTLRTTAKTAKTLQEVSDLADKLKMAQDISKQLT